VLFFAAKGLCQLLALWVRKRNFFSLAASRSEAKKLWLNKVAVKSRREVVVAQHSRHKNIPTPASSHPKPDGDRKCIVPVVEDVSFENPTGKAPPECGQVPFAAEDGRRVKRLRQRIVLHRNPKKTSVWRLLTLQSHVPVKTAASHPTCCAHTSTPESSPTFTGLDAMAG
jgi:hypothetical protein